MALDQYRRKRNFRKTPEPDSAVPAKQTGKLRFVVQKHKASRLHYDFRLENKGVLKSWAVPKGFSMDPKIKHLAIQVEDHPYEYKDFEGVIPEGNYGAGRVIIWDEGTYYPADTAAAKPEEYVSEALAKGYLNFILEGKKLKGRFMLVKLKRRENQWLLIKGNDSYSRKYTAFDESSLRTGRKVDDDLAVSLEGIDFSGAVKGPMPSGVRPMAAAPADKSFDGEKWIFEVKWDGYRSLAEIKEGRVRLYSRNNKTQNELFPEVSAAFAGYPFDALFDGEIVVLDKQGRPDFQMLQNYIRNRSGRIAYYVFDALYAGEYDLRMLPLRRRKDILKKILPLSEIVRLSGFIEKDGRAFYRAAWENGLEGIMAKNLDSEYRPGIRSAEWLKLKIQKRQEAVIGGFTRPRSSRKYFGALVLGVYKQGELKYVAHTGGGFNEDSLRFVYEKLKPLVTDQSPFIEPPKTNMPVTWVKPELVCEVKFEEWTEDGHMRQPIFLGLREDKPASEVIREEPESLVEPSRSPSLVRMNSGRTKAVLTNLEKVYWPKEGYTKGDVIDYYSRVAKWMLPYLKNRPQVMNRHPNGISEPGFFQKDVEPGMVPDWIKTVKISSEINEKEAQEVKEINYVICGDTDTLIFLANLGCIEINVWNSVIDNLRNPDYMVFDFDPVDIGFSKVVEAVLATKQVLDEIGLPGFCKTSGGKGMHIYVPLTGDFSYEQTKDFAHLINTVVERRLPKYTSLERSPARRKGAVYLDYLQNRFGATMAAPYSLRPREAAPVSTPLEWNEVTLDINPLDFNIRTVLPRLARKADIWQDFLKQRINIALSLSALEKLL